MPESEARRRHEALQKRRRLMMQALVALVLAGIGVLVYLVVSGAWAGAAPKAMAALREKQQEYKAENDEKILKDEGRLRDTIGYPGAKLVFSWRFRMDENRNDRLNRIVTAAVEAKPSEICCRTITRYTQIGLPPEEFKVDFTLNGSSEVDYTHPDGRVEKVTLSNDMDEQLLCDIIMQQHAKAYGEVQWPLEVAPPPPPEAFHRESGEDVVPQDIPKTPEGVKLPELELP